LVGAWRLAPTPTWRRSSLHILQVPRSALERINNRIDTGFWLERHFIRGRAQMQTRIGLPLAVMRRSRR